MECETIEEAKAFMSNLSSGSFAYITSNGTEKIFLVKSNDGPVIKFKVFLVDAKWFIETMSPTNPSGFQSLEHLVEYHKTNILAKFGHKILLSENIEVVVTGDMAPHQNQFVDFSVVSSQEAKLEAKLQRALREIEALKESFRLADVHYRREIISRLEEEIKRLQK